jgi:hypothetical protein
LYDRDHAGRLSGPPADRDARYSARTAICAGFASACLGTVTVSTPFL